MNEEDEEKKTIKIFLPVVPVYYPDFSFIININQSVKKT